MSENRILDSRLVEKGKKGFFGIIFGRTTMIILLLLIQVVLLFEAFEFLGKYLYVAFGGYLAFSAINMMYIINTDDDPTIKLSWCVIIGMVPVFGASFYWFVRKDLGHRVEKRVMASTIQESLHYAPEQEELYDRLSKENPRLSQLAGYTKKNGGYTIYDNSDVEYYPLGEKKLEALCEALRNAKSFIFMEYFIINKGSAWSEILEILARKAAENVEVRLMYDGTLNLAALPHDYPEQLQRIGIKCKVFSSITPLVTVAYNNRDHRKIAVIDGQVAFTGGVNLADEYMNRKTVYGHWKDTAVKVTGEAVKGFTLMFLQMWNATEKEHEYARYMNVRPSLPEKSRGYVIPYADSPLDHEKVGEMVYIDIINRAEKYVYIMTPYLILDKEMINALSFAAKKGVDVRILLPHIPDKKYAFALAKSHYRELYGAGVKIYEYKPGFVHAKVFLSDDIRAVVGTINLDYRSLYLHFECAAYMEGVAAIEDIVKDFEACFESSILVDSAYIKNTAIWYKMVGSVLKLVAPLM